MLKRIFIIFITILLAITLAACGQTNGNEADFDDFHSDGTLSSQDDPTLKPQSTDIITTKNYKENDEIEIGNNEDIIAKQGTFKNEVFWRNCFWFLGIDDDGNFITFNHDTNDIEKIDSNGNISILINIMGERKNKIFAIKKYGDIIAWSECPHGDFDPIADETNGAGWGLYFADLKTKKITKIDGDKGITVPEGTQYGYLAPNDVFISEDHITYISFDHAPDGEVTAVIKLYTMSTGNLEIVDYLNEDLTKYAFGYPNISGDKMVWCKALVNPDGTYTGESYLYDLKTKVKSKLATDENIINPRINGNYIFAQGLPNVTFYDSEVCIYDIDKNQWNYKINNDYSEYNMMNNVYLTSINTVGNYVFWDTGVMRSLVVFNKSDNKLYNIVRHSDDKEITSAMLEDGGLLIWFEKPWGVHGGYTRPTYKYCFLK